MPEAGARLTLYTALAGLLSPPSEEMFRAAASREFAEALHAGFRLCRVQRGRARGVCRHDPGRGTGSPAQAA